MAEETVHLHKNYNAAYCGEDASHIKMTHSVEDTTCGKCLDELEVARKRFDALNNEATELNASDNALRQQYADDVKNLREKHENELQELGKKATDLTERRTKLTEEFTNLPQHSL
jgi:predicted  nucleic acid-binding Zn-ribbon protein